MAPNVANTVVGKYGNVYVVPHGTTAPFTIPPNATVNVNSALPAAWLAGNLGYLHEEDTPTLGFDTSTERVGAWQLPGGTLRNLLTGKVRSMQLTCREFNRDVWELVEPGTTYTAGASGTVTATIPAVATNPPKAGLFEIQDLDFAVKLLIYVPRLSVSELGELQFVGNDTGNMQITFEFEQTSDTDPPYYIATNHPGLVNA